MPGWLSGWGLSSCAANNRSKYTGAGPAKGVERLQVQFPHTVQRPFFPLGSALVPGEEEYLI